MSYLLSSNTVPAFSFRKPATGKTCTEYRLGQLEKEERKVLRNYI